MPELRFPKYILDHCRKLLLVNPNADYDKLLSLCRTHDIRYARIDTASLGSCECQWKPNCDAETQLMSLIVLSEAIKQYDKSPHTHTNQLCLDVFVNERGLTIPQINKMLCKYASKYFNCQLCSPADLRMKWFKKVYKQRTWWWPKKQKLLIQYAFLYPNGSKCARMTAPPTHTSFAQRSKLMHQTAENAIADLFKSDDEMVKFFCTCVLEPIDFGPIFESLKHSNLTTWTKMPQGKNKRKRSTQDEEDEDICAAAARFIRLLKGPKFLLPAKFTQPPKPMEKRLLLHYLAHTRYDSLVQRALSHLKSALALLESDPNIVSTQSCLFTTLAQTIAKPQSLPRYLNAQCGNPEFINLGSCDATVQLVQTAVEFLRAEHRMVSSD